MIPNQPWGPIFISGTDAYDKDMADPGFQIERLLTAEGELTTQEDCYRAMSQRTDGGGIYHLQVMRFGPFRVLTNAEVDGAIYLDEERSLVEIKSRKDIYNEKLFFQMLSNGSE